MRMPFAMLDFPLLSLAISHPLRPEMMGADEHSEDLDDMENEVRLDHVCWLDVRR